MYPSEAKDLAVSVLIYMVAIVFGLSLFVVPLYLATRPTVVENAGASAATQTVDRALVDRSSRKRFPVANLKHETIVNPATIAELNAKAKDSDDDRPRTRYGDYARPQPRHSYADGAPVRQRSVYPNFSTLR
jgi:hypothetical protein